MRLLSLIGLLLGGLFLAGVLVPDTPRPERTAVVSEPTSQPEPEAPEVDVFERPIPQSESVATVEPETVPQAETVPQEDVTVVIELDLSEPTPVAPIEELDTAEAEPALVEPPTETEPETARLDFSPTAIADTLATIDLDETAEPEAPVQKLFVVTGNRVNLRGGPSTNDAVLAQLVSGDRAIMLIEDQNGWSKISAKDGTVEGWMAARFLAEDGAVAN